MKPKNRICLWYDNDAQDAARFYAATFPDSEVVAVHKAPGDYPGGKEGNVLVVDFTVVGIPCMGINGGPAFRHSEAFSFQITTENQEETDRYWNAIVGNGGQESECGWCRDRWGLSWQITPRVLTEAMAAGGAEAKRVLRRDDDDEEDRRRRHRGSPARLTGTRLLITACDEQCPGCHLGNARHTSCLRVFGEALQKIAQRLRPCLQQTEIARLRPGAPSAINIQPKI